MALERIDLNGRPVGRFPATPHFLCALRRPGFETGTEDPMEVRLIQRLLGRAMNASHVLPAIVPTQRTPGWSKLVLPAFVVKELQGRGGGLE